MTVAIVLPAWLVMIMGFCILSNQGLGDCMTYVLRLYSLMFCYY